MQNNKQSVTPHDNFFKLLMEVRENAAEVIRAGLPATMVQNLDLSTLKSMSTSFSGSKSPNYFADVIYECTYRQSRKVTLCLLFEHKSYPVAFPHFQLLSYMNGIWLRQIKNHLQPQPVIPILFYHGQQDWPHRDFVTSFASDHTDEPAIDDELKVFLPEFDYVLINLQQKGDDWIRERIRLPGLRVSFLVMRNIRSQDLLKLLPSLLAEEEKYWDSEEGNHLYEDIFVYLTKGSKVPNEKIKEVMDSKAFLNTPNPVGSGAWQMEQRVRAETIVEVATKMLKAGLEVAQIIEFTELESEKIQELQAQIS